MRLAGAHCASQSRKVRVCAAPVLTGYLPTRIAELTGGKVDLAVGMLTAIPWLCALVVTWWVTRLADRAGTHRRLAALMLVCAGGGIAASALTSSLVPVIIAFCFAASGFVSVQPLYWTLPTNYLGGVAAAGGNALINALGNVGGFVAPNIKIWAERAFADPRAGMLTLAFIAFLGAVMLTLMRRMITLQPRVSRITRATDSAPS